MGLNIAEKTLLKSLEAQEESGVLDMRPGAKEQLEELREKQGDDRSSLFNNLGIFSTAQASEIDPNNPPSMLPKGAMDTETPFGDMLKPEVPRGGSIFSGREFGNIRGGIVDGSAGQRFNMENNPELFFNTAAGQAKADEKQDFFDYLQGLSGGVVDFAKDITGRTIASQVLSGAGAMLNPYLAVAGGITGLLRGGDLFNSNSLSQRNFDMRTPEAQAYASSLYGPGGLLEGYNQFSAFGKGAAGTIDKSIGRIMRTLQKKDSPFLEDRLGKLQAARDKITGTIRDSSGTITGGTGQGTIDSENTGGYGGTGGEGLSAVSSSGMLGGGV